MNPINLYPSLRAVSYYAIVCCIMVSLSCNKDHNNTSAVPKIGFVAEEATPVLPGSLLTLLADKPVPADTCTVRIGNKQVTLAKLDDVHYCFIVPVLPPGKYALDLQKLTTETGPEISIADYEPITNPAKLANDLIVDYGKSVDTLVMNDMGTTEKEAEFMYQLANQIRSNIAGMNAEEKELIAYQLSNARKDIKKVLALNWSPRPGLSINSINARSISVQGSEDETLDALLNNRLLVATAANNAAKSALTIAKASMVAAILLPSPHTATFFLIAASASAFLKAKAATLNEEVSHMNNLASRLESVGGGSSSSPIELASGESAWQKMNGVFRTIRQDDNGKISNDITIFLDDNVFIEREDNIIKEKFSVLKDKISDLLDLITESYDAYISPVLKEATEKAILLAGTRLSISNVSNKDIVVNISGEGEKGIQLTVTNPAKNITTEQSFNCEITYTPKEIGNKVSVVLNFIFKPAAVLPVLITGDISEVTFESAVSGGNIYNDGGSGITGRGVCWSTSHNPTIKDDISNDGNGKGVYSSIITGLAENSVYFVRAYATNSAGTAYGDERSFRTRVKGSNVLTILAPAENAVLPWSSGPVEFKWTSYTNATIYSIEIEQERFTQDNKPTGEFIALHQNGVTETNYSRYFTNNMGKFRFRISARNGNTELAQTAWRYFTFETR